MLPGIRRLLPALRREARLHTQVQVLSSWWQRAQTGTTGSAPTLPPSQGAPRDNSGLKGFLIIFSFIPTKIRRNPPSPCPVQPLGDSWPVARASGPAPAGAELGMLLGCWPENWPVHFTAGQIAASPKNQRGPALSSSSKPSVLRRLRHFGGFLPAAPRPPRFSWARLLPPTLPSLPPPRLAGCDEAAEGRTCQEAIAGHVSPKPSPGRGS